jgi:predicted RNase H-like HicB family nuclease
MHKKNFQVILEQDEDGWFIADVPALMGCHTQGRTEAEALENIKDVIKLCVDELTSEGKKLSFEYPHVIEVKEVEVLI